MYVLLSDVCRVTSIVGATHSVRTSLITIVSVSQTFIDIWQQKIVKYIVSNTAWLMLDSCCMSYHHISCHLSWVGTHPHSYRRRSPGCWCTDQCSHHCSGHIHWCLQHKSSESKQDDWLVYVWVVLGVWVCICKWVHTMVMWRVSTLQLRSLEASMNPDLHAHVKKPPLLIQMWAQLCVPSSPWLIAAHKHKCLNGIGISCTKKDCECMIILTSASGAICLQDEYWLTATLKRARCVGTLLITTSIAGGALINVIVCVSVWGSSWKPELHPQLNPPTLLEKVWSQLSVLVAHLFISAKQESTHSDSIPFTYSTILSWTPDNAPLCSRLSTSLPRKKTEVRV